MAGSGDTPLTEGTAKALMTRIAKESPFRVKKGRTNGRIVLHIQDFKNPGPGSSLTIRSEDQWPGAHKRLTRRKKETR